MLTNPETVVELMHSHQMRLAHIIQGNTNQQQVEQFKELCTERGGDDPVEVLAMQSNILLGQNILDMQNVIMNIISGRYA